MTNYNCVRGVFIWIDITQPSVHPYRPLSLRAKRGNPTETKCRPHIRASQLTYTVKVLSLRGAQRATRQSPGREDGRSVHEQIPFSRGISPLRPDYRPHSGRNDIINSRPLMPSPLGRDGLFQVCATVYKEQHYTTNRTRLSFRALVEKSPAIETTHYTYATTRLPTIVPRSSVAEATVSASVRLPRRCRSSQ